MIQAFSQALQRDGYIDRAQLDLLRHRARLMGGELDRHAIEMGLLGADEVVSVYAQTVALPAVRSLDLDRINAESSGAFPARLAARWRLIPVQQTGLSWQVLSDQHPSAERRAEVRTTLGVEILVRAVPPFLYEILAHWLRGEPHGHDLALLVARLYPRFIVSQAQPLAESPDQVRPVAMQESGLPRRLMTCQSGRACLEQTEQFLTQRNSHARVWHIDGPVLRRFGAQASVLPLSEVPGLAAALSESSLQHVQPVPQGWNLLCSAQKQTFRSLALRIIELAGRPVALAVIGAQHLHLDAAALDGLDRAAWDLKAALKGRLG